MIQEFATDLAKQMGIILSSVSLADGQTLGCHNMYILDISSKGRLVSTLVHQSDLDITQNGSACDRLEVVIRSALTKIVKEMDTRNVAAL